MSTQVDENQMNYFFLMFLFLSRHMSKIYSRRIRKWNPIGKVGGGGGNTCRGLQIILAKYYLYTACCGFLFNLFTSLRRA